MEILPSTKEDCKLCLVASSSAQVAVKSSGAPVLKTAESIFFECIQFTLQTTGQVHPVSPALMSKINSFIDCDDMKKLTGSNWRVRVPVLSLLKSALKGDKQIEFDSSDKIDTNSAALYTVLVDALNGRLRLMREQFPDINIPVVNRPFLYWTCPNCEQRYGTRTSSCKMCNIAKKVVVLSQKGSIGAIVQQVTDLVISCIALHTQRTSAAVRVNEMTSLSRSITELLDAESLKNLVTSNWRIQDCLSHLLRTALAGDPKTISFESATWMDVNSTTIYLIIADRINARLNELHPDSGYCVVRPTIEKFNSDLWNCPSCDRQVAHDKKTCPLCYVNKSVITLCRQGVASPVLSTAEELFMSCVNLHCSSVEGAPSSQTHEDRTRELQNSVTEFINSTSIASLASSNWRIKDAVSHLLRTALAGETRTISFESESWMDVNSIAVYLILADRINARLAKSCPDSGYTVQRPEMVKFDAEHWNCPNCQRSIEHETEVCPVCSINKKVYSIASGPVMNAIETLLMSCIEAHCGLWEGESSKEDRLIELKAEVEKFVEGDDLKSLTSSNWRLRDAASHVLQMALKGEARTLTFHSETWMDINSRVAYMILVDRVNSRLADSEQCAGYTVERPVLSQPNKDFWSCPNCKREIAHEVDTCKVCSINKKVLQLEHSPQTGPVLKSAENLFMSCVELHCGAWTGAGSREDRESELRMAVTALMDGEEMTTLLGSKWRVKEPISHLLRTALAGETRTISFESESWMDVNSTASYLLLVDRINARLTESYPDSGYTVQRPNIHQNDEKNWQCPGCSVMFEIDGVGSCPTCKISKKVLNYFRSSQVGPVFKKTQNLFMSCVELHCGAWTGAGSREDRESELRTAVTALMDGEGLNAMVTAKWRVKEPISHMLTSVLEGQDRVITFEAPSNIDNNSKGLYMLLVDSINARLDIVAPNSGFWVKRPVVATS
jgi:rubrerythrin